MCVVSMISEHYENKWREYIVDPSIPQYNPPKPNDTLQVVWNAPTRDEFNRLQAEVKEMKELLTKALDYDRKTNQIECSNEEKIEFLEKVAKISGVDCSELFKELRTIHKKKKVVRKKK